MLGKKPYFHGMRKLEARKRAKKQRLAAQDNAWGQMGHGSPGNFFTKSGQAVRHYEEPINIILGTDSSFLNKGDGEGVSMKGPAAHAMLAMAKKPYWHGMHKLARRQGLKLKPKLASPEPVPKPVKVGLGFNF